MERRAPYRIVLAVDGSRGADRAVELVRELPFRARDEVLVTMRPELPAFPRPRDDDAVALLARVSTNAQRRAEEIVERATRRIRDAGVRTRAVPCASGDVVESLLRVVEREQAALLVVGSRGRGAWRSVLLGSTARALAMLSTCPVLVVRGPVTTLRVLAAVDGSAPSLDALRAFARMPQAEGTYVELLHVLPRHRWQDREIDWVEIGRRSLIEGEEESAASALLTLMKKHVPEGVSAITRSVRGHVAETILARANAMRADLIVVGTRGVQGPRQLFLGSTAEMLLTHARANVLLAPHPAGS